MLGGTVWVVMSRVRGVGKSFPFDRAGLNHFETFILSRLSH
jgi:hypothetical protein